MNLKKIAPEKADFSFNSNAEFEFEGAKWELK